MYYITSKLEDHSLSTAHDCFIQHIRSYRPYLEAVSSIRNLRTCHVLLVTGGPLNIVIIMILSMALQPFVRPWPLVQFLNLYIAGRTPWKGDQPVAKPLLAYTGQHKHRINAHTHASKEFQPRIPSVRAGEDSSCLRPRGQCDQPNYKCS
jgi:hypothetical protein